MKKTIRLAKKAAFVLKWKAMSQEKRYAYLWAKTKKSVSQNDEIIPSISD